MLQALQHVQDTNLHVQACSHEKVAVVNAEAWVWCSGALPGVLLLLWRHTKWQGCSVACSLLVTVVAASVVPGLCGQLVGTC